ncbi:septum formation family protein [Actinomadura sp. NPDC048955]|uniref:septum formation family protein n=1 Tax=Actinomadura sp. NPDC048955 TaxID=3158228 RepID=UPI0033DE9E28
MTALIAGAVGLAVPAIGLAVAALVQTRRRGGKGRGLAVAALVMSGAWLTAGAVLLSVAAGNGENRGPETGGPRASALSAGDCFINFRREGAKVFAQAAPCEKLHQGEVLAVPVLPAVRYPGEERLAADAQGACRREAAPLYEAGRGEEFTLVVDRPDRRAWEGGDHAVRCLLRYSDGAKMYILSNAPRMTSELAAGDCVGTWSDSGSVELVDCDQKHEVQVFARVTLKQEKYPNDAQVLTLCADRARKVFGTAPPKDLLLRYAGPDELEWARGQRDAVCLVTSRKGRLSRSLVPELKRS